MFTFPSDQSVMMAEKQQMVKTTVSVKAKTFINFVF